MPKEHRESYRFSVKQRRDAFYHQLCCDFPQYNQYRQGVGDLVEYVDWLERQFGLSNLSQEKANAKS